MAITVLKAGTRCRWRGFWGSLDFGVKMGVGILRHPYFWAKIEGGVGS